MKFVQYSSDSLCSDWPLIQFNFTSRDDLETHPFIRAVMLQSQFVQFVLDDMKLDVVLMESGRAVYLTLGYVYGAARKELQYATIENMLEIGQTLPRPSKGLSAHIHHGLGHSVADRRRNLTAREYIDGQVEAVPALDVMSDWMVYWRDGTTSAIRGASLSDALVRSGYSSDDESKIDFTHLGHTQTHVWSVSESDWVPKHSKWRQ